MVGFPLNAYQFRSGEKLGSESSNESLTVEAVGKSIKLISLDIIYLSP